MVFKLVQIDSDNPHKIILELGTHVFGRGKYLNVNDKRISRQHGQFEVSDESLIITALHQNPCFYQKNGTTQAEILRQSCSVSLNSGDKVGLLPTSHWYEVLQCTPVDNEENMKTDKKCKGNISEEIMVDSNEDTDNEAEPKLDSVPELNVVSENDNINSQSTEVLSPCDLVKEQNPEGIDTEKQKCDNQNAPTIEETGVDSVDYDSYTAAHLDEPHLESLLTTNQELKEKSNEAGACSDQSSALQKRSHSISDSEQSEEVKKIKTESGDKPDVKLDPDAQQASSSSADSNAGSNPTQAVPSAAPVPLRERCMYGAACYRRNPAHRAQFSHPHDVDWGTGEKVPCPWGAACRKRDPRHWRDHDHPPGKELPPPPPGVRVVHRQGNVFYINAHTVNFHDDHFEAEDSDGNSVDYDYEF